jgi:hypothetical protein
LFAQINKSLKNNEVFTELVEKEFDFVNPSMEQAERRLEEYIEKHRKELEDGGMA